jgi:hypothetical protein
MQGIGIRFPTTAETLFAAAGAAWQLSYTSFNSK